MPQMAPLLWLNIMFITLLTLLTLTTLNYFSKSNNTETSASEKMVNPSKKWLW